VSELAPAAAAFDPGSLVGTTLDGRYELTAHLATGGMGAVFRARHVHLRKEVAVKVLRPDLSAASEIVERFRREAEIASALEHENIVRVTDFGRTDGGWLFLVMELLAGESLFDRIRRERLLSPEDAVPILWQVCAGLEAAHAMGVVHRDLKPENVFLARTASGREVTKILDFGICKITDPASGSATQAGMVVGTPEYLSPEQAMGGEVDVRADLYTVGLIGWRILAGRHPFKTDDPRALLMMQATKPVPPLTEPRPDLAGLPLLVSAVARACAKEPADRPQTAGALRQQLQAALGTAFVMPPGATPAPPLSLAALPAASPQYDAASTIDPTRSFTPPAAPPSRSLLAAIRLARVRLAFGRLTNAARDTARRLGRRAASRGRNIVGHARARPRLAGAAGVALLAAVGLAGVAAWNRGRAVAEAEELLVAGRAREAAAVLDGELARRPGDPALLVLKGRALHRVPGAVSDGVEAYQAAYANGPLDPHALQDLAQDLGRERSLADRAARLLRDVGPAAVPVVAAAAIEGAGPQRLRALTLLRDLGAEETVDRMAAYGVLLADLECEIRRAAARRLGELGDPAALPRLRDAASARVEKRSFFGTSKTPACGAAEAAEAVRRIEAAH
jgi:eukaryotic-like serine/threonine-protein kinase